MFSHKIIVFICTGNTCRSQMAAALFCDSIPCSYVEQITVCSAGLMAHAGEQPAENAILAMAQLGIDITANRAVNLSPELLEKAHLFACMSQNHVESMLNVGVSPEKIMNLNINDPYGGDLETYLKCRDLIFSKLPDVYERLGI